MNELLQKHGCHNVFTIPEGLRELMGDISREVLREQPSKIYDFIANYLSALLITREHGILAVKLLDDLCDCKPSVSEHLINIGMSRGEANDLADIIKEEVEGLAMVEGKEKVREQEIIRRILARKPLDEEMTAKVCDIARNAYKDYWYRRKLMEQNLKETPDEPWEIAVQHTLNIYKKTKPSFSELTRATLRIQAAYKGYHVRRQMLGHLKPKKPQDPKVDLPGPPVDIGDSRRIDLGRVVDIKDKVKIDNVDDKFMKEKTGNLDLGYDTMKTLTMHEEPPDREGRNSRMLSSKDMTTTLYEPPPEKKRTAGFADGGFPGQPMTYTVMLPKTAPLGDTKESSESFSPKKDSPKKDSPLKDPLAQYDIVLPDGEPEQKISSAPLIQSHSSRKSPVDEILEDIQGGTDVDSAPTSVPSSGANTARSSDIDDDIDEAGDAVAIAISSDEAVDDLELVDDVDGLDIGDDADDADPGLDIGDDADDANPGPDIGDDADDANPGLDIGDNADDADPVSGNASATDGET